MKKQKIKTNRKKEIQTEELKGTLYKDLGFYKLYEFTSEDGTKFYVKSY